MQDVTEEQEVDDPKVEGSNLEGSSEKKKSKKASKDNNDSGDDNSDDDNSDDDNSGSDDEYEEVDYLDLINYDEMKKGLGLTGGICKGWTKIGRYGRRPVIQFGPKSSPIFRTIKAS